MTNEFDLSGLLLAQAEDIERQIDEWLIGLFGTRQAAVAAVESGHFELERRTVPLEPDWTGDVFRYGVQVRLVPAHGVDTIVSND